MVTWDKHWRSCRASGRSGRWPDPNLVIDFDDAAYLGAETFGGATALPSVQTDPDGVDQSMLQIQKPAEQRPGLV